MRALAYCMLCLTLITHAAAADSFADCEARRVKVAKQAESFAGEPRIRRLILADIKRAGKELEEGDVDECVEALDHAEKLLSGQF